MAVTYEKLVGEDLQLGHGNHTVTMPGGGTATGSKVGIHTFIPVTYNLRDFADPGGMDCYDAFQTIFGLIEAADTGSVQRGSRIILPFGEWYCTRKLVPTRKCIWEGVGGSCGDDASGKTRNGSALIFPAGVTGIEILASNGAYYSIFKDFALRAQGKSGTVYGFLMTGRAFLSRMHVFGFGSHGVNITASTPTGNDNNWRVAYCRLEGNGGDGLHVEGTDANAGLALHNDYVGNTGYGIWARTSYGNEFIGGNVESNVAGGILSGQSGGYFQCRNAFRGIYVEGGQVNDINEPAIVDNCSTLSGFTAGNAPIRIADGKIFLGATTNIGWGDVNHVSASSRGLYIDQGASMTNEALALAASGRVAHGMTGYGSGTATWFSLGQATASGGGALVYGLSEDVTALKFRAYGTGETTAEGASDTAECIIEAGKSNGGTGATTIGATGNLVAVQNAGVNKAIVKGDGTYVVRGTYGTRQAPDHLLVGTSTVTGMATGVRIDAAVSTNEIVSIRGTGRIAHGVTTLADTTTLLVQQIASTDGGVQTLAFSAAAVAYDLRGVAVTEDTTQGANSTAALMFDGEKKSGTGVTALGATANIAVFRSNSVARFILRADGSSFEDVGTAWTNFDAYADAEVLTALSVAASQDGDPIKALFMDTLVRYREVLERHELIKIEDQPDGSRSVFVNRSGVQNLLVGAVRQQADRLQRLEARLEAVEGTARGLMHRVRGWFGWA